MLIVVLFQSGERDTRNRPSRKCFVFETTRSDR